jgi:hypothetical protein
LKNFVFSTLSVFGSIGFLFFLACGKPAEPDTTSATNVSTAPSQVPKVENDSAPKDQKGPLLGLVTPEQAPNRYAVNFKWPSIGATSDVPWIILRKEEKGNLETIATLPGVMHEYTDRSAIGGKNYLYSLVQPSSEGLFRTIAETRIEIPQDLEIVGSQNLSSVQEINRLFLRAGSFLGAEGKSISINVNHLISEGGTIRTFLSPSPEKGHHGVLGGTIQVIAHSGIGILNVQSNGQDGTQGLDGTPGRTGTNGSPGEAGISEVVPPPFINIAPEPASVRCLRAPTSGGNGQNGAPGVDATSGGNGGDSGKLYVQIEDARSLKVIPLVRPGIGAPGGHGGPGGAPGAGGPAGALDALGICPKAEPGKPGQQGLPGKDGIPGNPGKAQAYCLRLSGVTFGDCDSFPALLDKVE